MRKILLLFLALPILFLSCNSNKCRQLCTEKGLDEDCCPKIDSTNLLTANAKIDKINIFIETSGSMAGYMPASKPATEFQLVITDILSKINSKFSGEVSIYFMAEQNKPCIKIDFEKAKNDVLNGAFIWSGSTYIPSMIDSVSDYLKTNSVNILVSDFIYSPEKGKSKITEIASSDLYSLVTPFTKYSSSFICLFSEYRSSICADKNPTEKSPYYLFLQGKAENIRVIESVIYESISKSNSAYKEINFGLNYKMPYYSVLPYTETTSNYIANSCASFQYAFVSIQDINLDSYGSKIEFWLGLDLNDFPEYSKTKDYLKQNLEISLNNGEFEILTIEKLPYSNVASDDKPIAQRCTHIVKLKISNLSECVSVLSLSLKCSLPDWRKSLNENVSENNREKTFGLEKIISGFEQAYCQKQGEYFFKNLPISLIKE